MSEPEIRIALAEDHQLLRNTIISVLNDQDDFEVVIGAKNGAELLEGLETHEADVILLDLNMPVLDGRDTLPVIIKKYPNLKIIVLSMYYGEAYIEKYMRLGAHGYLSKDCAPEFLTQAVRDVYRDGYFLHEKTPAKVLSSLIESEVYVPKEPSYPLSELEKDVVTLICDQKENIEIAEALDLTEEQVARLRSEIMSKLGARNDAGIIGYALKNDLYRLMM